MRRSPPPDPDQEVHRDEDDLPEDVVEKQVERAEDPDQPELEQQQIGVELFLPGGGWSARK
jgi:hypothetical protein